MKHLLNIVLATLIMGPASIGTASDPSAAFRQDPAVTYSTVAVSVKKAVQDIAKVTGAKLDVADAAANEIVVISVKDAPLSELMKRIADVTSCEWKTDSGGIQWLNYSTEKTRKEQADETAEHEKQVAKGVTELLKDREPIPADVEEEGANSEILDMDSEGKAIFKILKLIPTSAIASVLGGERLVYSTSPTRMQRGLGNIDAIIADLIAEHNKEAKARVDAQKAAEEDDPQTVEQQRQQREMQAMFGGFGGRFVGQDKQITVPPAKVLFVVSNEGVLFLQPNITFEMRLYDAAGKVILSSEQWLPSGESFADMVPNPQEANAPQEPQPAKGTPIEFSPLAREFASLTDFREIANRDRTPSQALMERLIRPDLYDPLSFADSEAFLAVAKAKNVNLICNLPDNMESILQAFTKGTATTVESFLAQVKANDKLQVKEGGGWMQISPSSRVESRAIRVDRRALTDLIAAGRSKGTPSLDDVATYALKCDEPAHTAIVSPYIMMFAQKAFAQGMRGQTDWTMLRIYGNLSASQRQLLWSGSALPVRSLNPGIKKLVDKMAFGAPVRLQVERPENKSSTGPFMEMLQRMMPTAPVDYRDEPTEIMPAGLPQDAFLSMKGSNEYFVVPIMTGPDPTGGMMGALGADELAMLQWIKETPQLQQMGADGIPTIDKVRVGDRKVMDFAFHFAPGVTRAETLMDDSLAKNAPETPMAALPEGFKALIQKKLEALRKEKFPFFGGGGPPPPPPF
jgi:hypothetical protein